MTATVDRAVIVGAGIAGLTTAIALRRLGIEADVYERSRELRTIGGGIHLWHNAMNAYRELGIGPQVAAVGQRMAEAQFRTDADRLLARWPVGDLDALHGTVTVGISREDLLRVLLAEVPADRVHAGWEFAGLTERPDGVAVRFNGDRVVNAGLVVGADGIRSAVRAATKGAPRLRFAGYVVWQGTVAGIPAERARPGEFRVYYGPGQRFAWYHIRGERLYWFALFDAPEEAPEEADIRPVLAARFRGWPDPITEVIERTAPEGINRLPMRDRRPDGDWSTPRTTLVGDAAHAMTFNIGQGACMGVEDAHVLSTSLAAAPDLGAGLARYQRVRAPRTTQYVNRSWKLGAMARWRNPIAVAFRNRMMRLIMSTVAWRGHQKEMTYPT